MYEDIDEIIFKRLPESINNPNKVCKLNKSIYGFKKSPKDWNIKFDNVMQNKGFKKSKNDYCLYSKIIKNGMMYVLMYVD